MNADHILAVDPVNGYIFHWNGEGIDRSNLDGTYKQRVITADGSKIENTFNMPFTEREREREREKDGEGEGGRERGGEREGKGGTEGERQAWRQGGMGEGDSERDNAG